MGEKETKGHCKRRGEGDDYETVSLQRTYVGGSDSCMRVCGMRYVLKSIFTHNPCKHPVGVLFPFASSFIVSLAWIYTLANSNKKRRPIYGRYTTVNNSYSSFTSRIGIVTGIRQRSKNSERFTACGGESRAHDESCPGRRSRKGGAPTTGEGEMPPAATGSSPECDRRPTSNSICGPSLPRRLRSGSWRSRRLSFALHGRTAPDRIDDGSGETFRDVGLPRSSRLVDSGDGTSVLPCACDTELWFAARSMGDGRGPEGAGKPLFLLECSSSARCRPASDVDPTKSAPFASDCCCELG